MKIDFATVDVIFSLICYIVAIILALTGAKLELTFILFALGVLFDIRAEVREMKRKIEGD